MGKVLIVTYYWPPSAGVGVQRWLKLSKYLSENGWDPVIFTPENPDFSVKDKTLEKQISPEIEVIRFPIWEPFQFFHALTGGKNKNSVKQGVVLEKTKQSLFEKASVWIRGNFLLPDPRVFWVKPSIKYLLDIVDKNQIDAVITTGPPHSMHLIGLGLKKTKGLKWLADFRDPWSEWDLLPKLKTTTLAHSIHRKLEQKVLKKADCILTVGPRLAEGFTALGAKKVEVLYNGVDPEDYEGLTVSKPTPTKFIISHIGLMNDTRNPSALWKALRELIEENEVFADNFQLNLAGIVSENILDDFKKDPLLSEKLVYTPYLSHEDVFKEAANSSLLMVILNNTDNARWILPMKMYEYLSVGRPILLLGPEKSDAEGIIESLKAGFSVRFDDKDSLKRAIEITFQDYINGNIERKAHDMAAFDRKSQAKRLAAFLDELVLEK
ncbi:glycosyltransferase family 4 protein [Xanthovirga aplysinae]|uniref:glycosyltransferase family 4 protein n=1 Tax=Xanthovirga aplysinae TaxID=2529853 RepID=UPI0012BB5CC1|nr:glycosyltransferase family 4 protein [Xanthovirga aplysinae]MTI31131.1 glycosyl transferase family 1 [Xanthovirga aplysinae]